MTVLPGNVASGTFVEVDPPRRLVFTWGWEPGGMDGPGSAAKPGSTTVEIKLEPGSESERTCASSTATCRARKRPRSAAHGWERFLERLVTAASGKRPAATPGSTARSARVRLPDMFVKVLKGRRFYYGLMDR